MGLSKILPQYLLQRGPARGWLCSWWPGLGWGPGRHFMKADARSGGSWRAFLLEAKASTIQIPHTLIEPKWCRGQSAIGQGHRTISLLPRSAHPREDTTSLSPGVGLTPRPSEPFLCTLPPPSLPFSSPSTRNPGARGNHEMVAQNPVGPGDALLLNPSPRGTLHAHPSKATCSHRRALDPATRPHEDHSPQA